MLKKGSKDNSRLDNSVGENLLGCLFCYKICDDAKGNNNVIDRTRKSNNNVKTTELEHPSQLLQKFLLLFRKCLIDINCIKRSDTLNATDLFQGRIEDGFQLLGTCQDCSILIRDFCSLYDSIKCLELKLNWRLKNLLEIMKCAEKVPSRVKAFRNHVGSNNRGKSNISPDETLTRIRKIRNELKEKCSAKLQSSYPRIVLKRVGSSQATNSALGTTKRVKVEAATVDHASLSNATTYAIFSENKSEIVEKNESIPSTTAAEVDEDPVVEVSSVFFVKVAPSEEYDENCERDTTADIEGGQRDTTDTRSQPPDKLDPENFDDADLQSSLSPSPILSPGVNGIDDDDGEPDIPSSSITSNNEYLVKTNEVNEASEMPQAFNVKVEVRDIKVEKDAASSFTNTNEFPVKVSPDENVFEPLKKSVKKRFSAKKVEYHRRQTKRLLKKAKTNTKSVSRKRGRGKRRRIRYGVYPSISNGKRILLNLKQLALNKVMRLRRNLRCCVHPCENKSFINATDFINHSKYHGEFKCNFCEKVLTYAPDLLKHEIDAHREPREDVEKSQVCPRCAYSCSSRGRNSQSVLFHFLESHLNITPTKNTCSICCATIGRKESVRNVFLDHYRNNHDMTGVEISTIKKCDVSNCRAYFRTHFQLNQHKLKIHKITTKMKYFCRDCGKRFQNLFDLQHHQLNHTVQTVFKVACPIPECKTFFETEADLLHHERRYHSCEMIDCPCCKESIGKPYLSAHLKKHKTLDTHKLKIHRCLKSGCKKEFYNVSDLENHSRLHGEFSCQFCEDVFTFAPSLPIHEIKCQKRGNADEDNGTERFTCTRCMLSVNTVSKLIGHFVEEHLHLEIDSHTCYICKAQISIGSYRVLKKVKSHFKQIHDLKNVDADRKAYACKIDGCSAHFLTSHQLVRHKHSHITAGKFKMQRDDVDGKAYECGDCKKRFKNITEARKHRVTVHLQMKFKKFTCISDGCKLRFETQAELDDHIADNDVLKCPKCEKSFHGATGLKVHENFHKKQGARRPRKQWICETCGKSFKEKNPLELHRFSHTGPDTWEFMCNTRLIKARNTGKVYFQARRISHERRSSLQCQSFGVNGGFWGRG